MGECGIRHNIPASKSRDSDKYVQAAYEKKKGKKQEFDKEEDHVFATWSFMKAHSVWQTRNAFPARLRAANSRL